ncbi:SDR family oxidoreductase [Bacillus sp. FJAT-42376]|uniref:oxidoreductase n=1 Tax=Bacillus sp. FJAT-42376 TaxID=2014076 RepID=UPI000F501D82|nr:oxidoreductase [Bacillus sp. FJAT-42376]AZB43437.1 SDR family oxidoreductase [Bacillus sp. FJAT-42376]
MKNAKIAIENTSNKKTILITGASSGFGMLASLELAKKGHTVIAAIRNMDKSKELLKLAEHNGCAEKISIHPLDVTSADSIEALQQFLKKTGKIDVLINNAGFAFGGFSEEITILEFKEQFETNFFGAIAVTQAVLPFMRAQKSGKIINMSSISGLIGFPGLSPYVSSKHALEGFSESLRLEVKPFGIDVMLIEPGSFSTNIWTTGKKVAEVSMDPHSPYFSYMTGIENELERGSAKHGDPMDVVRLITVLCEKRRVNKLRYPIGKGVRLTLLLKRVLPWRIWESIIIRRLLPKK